MILVFQLKRKKLKKITKHIFGFLFLKSIKPKIVTQTGMAFVFWKIKFKN